MAQRPAAVQLNAILGRVKNKIKSAQTAKVMRQFGNYVAETIVERTRSGRGVKKMFGNISKLARLKDSTIKKRELFKDLDQTTTPTTSNLTMTGQMLRSIKATAKDGVITIKPTGTRNIKLAQYAHDGSKYRQPRVFMNFSRGEMTTFVKVYRQIIGNLLKK